MPRFRLPLVAASLASAVLSPNLAAAAAFDGLVVFGDSLSDAGNVALVTAGLAPLVPPTPGPFYADGRFSNGPNYADVLSAGLGFGPTAASLAGGSNFAYGGARTTGTAFPASLVVQDLDDQVTAFLAGSPLADPGDLFVVYAGANDVAAVVDGGGGAGAAEAAARNVAAELGRLADAGATRFLTPNLPSLGLTPRFSGDAAASGRAAALTSAFNDELDASLDGLAASRPELSLFRLDVAALFANVLGNPAAFGFTNATDPAAPGLSPGASSYDTSRTVADPGGYLFYDDFHPTEAGHALLGRAALAAVPEPAAGLLLAGAFLLLPARRRCAAA